jgi:hypothetical protein
MRTAVTVGDDYRESGARGPCPDGDGNGGDGGDGNGGDELLTYTPKFEIEVGHVVVEDKDSGREMCQWKAITGEHEVVSDSPTDAVMGVIEKVTGGYL